ncbi:unnamed protein product [Lactuca saligna]|uniref:Uncharacterized protein n=1 Tax=Lactuca saligna TaxID=75948 RepID=A0AA36E9M1_LACSI|nr:unnamed protein product [Lactuca saligna]
MTSSDVVVAGFEVVAGILDINNRCEGIYLPNRNWGPVGGLKRRSDFFQKDEGEITKLPFSAEDSWFRGVFSTSPLQSILPVSEKATISISISITDKLDVTFSVCFRHHVDAYCNKYISRNWLTVEEDDDVRENFDIWELGSFKRYLKKPIIWISSINIVKGNQRLGHKC